VVPLPKERLPAGAWITVIAVLTLALAAATAYLYGPLVNARFGLIDDHEILAYFGTNKSVSVADLPRILSTQTEVGSWGHTLRFRPVYYVFRILETVWHGLDPAAWYLTRIVLVAVIAAIAGVVAYRVTVGVAATVRRQIWGFALAATAAVIVLTLPAWSDIVMRLGPSEIYVGLGIALFALGALGVWRARENWVGWVLLFVGFIIIVGSKEDGLIFLPLLAVLYLVRFPQTRVRIVAVVLGIIAVLFTIYVALGFLPATLSSRADVYGNGRSPALFLDRLIGNNFVAIALVCFVLAIAIDQLQNKNRDIPPRGDGFWHRLVRFLAIRPRTVISGIILYTVLAELYFYEAYFANNTFSFGRYGLATELAVAVGILVVATGIIELNGQGLLATGYVVVAALVLAILPPTLPQVVAAVRTYHLTSAETASSLKAQSVEIANAVKVVREHPRNQLLIIVQQPNDYEPIVGIASFLRLDDHIRSVFLNFQLAQPVPQSESDLVNQLKGFAKNGGWAQNGWKIAPTSEFNPTQPTTCIYFGNRPANTSQCSSVAPID
jgi:hypothetical protein